ncbi:MAG: LPXTG cell wall anchor domain-containing protein [Anaerolineae bacterium]
MFEHIFVGTVGMSQWLVLLAGAGLMAAGWFVRKKRVHTG